MLRAIVRKARRRWRSRQLRAAYGEICREWGTEDDLLWETTVGDGIDDEYWPNAPGTRP